MNRRDAVLALLALGVAPLSARAQQAKIPRVGYAASGSAASPGPLLEAFRQGLRDLGYIEGRNILVEYRYAEFKNERSSILVDELVQLKVDVLVVPTSGVLRAARQATRTIPIVMVSNDDPVATGIVDSMARPGANITGLYSLQRELSGKRLELLAESVPRLSRVAILWDPDSVSARIGFKEYEVAARNLKLSLQSLEARSPKPDLESAFQAATRGRAGAFVTVTNFTTFSQQKRVAELALKHRLPSVFEGHSWVDAGGLMSYSTDDAEVFRRAAVYVDKILKGAKPADLPIEQPTQFEFVVNLKTARALGLTIPQSVLLRANRVIE
ncbi:MAG: ABC transporter substrate-binding protein [Betaproteobacteria bacterium]|nr:ABC transporter substrate-binding protein [Betaproteobacteria bacterium]